MPLGKPASIGIALVTAVVLVACNEHITRRTEARVTSIDLTPLLDTLEIGDSLVVVAGPKDAKENPLSVDVRFLSRQPEIASIDEATGKVLALTKGIATIEASAGDVLKSASIVVIGSNELASISLAPTAVSIAVGAIAQVTATARNATGDPIAAVFAWSSENTSIATVNSNGFVTGVAAGSTTITAAFGNLTASIPVTVGAGGLASITIVPSTPSIQVGATLPLTASGTDSSGNTLPVAFSWYTANSTIAAVDATTGVITGVSVGKTNISAAAGGLIAVVPVTVSSMVGAISILPVSPSVQVGSQVSLAASATNGAGVPMPASFSWSTSNSAIATVGTNTGVVIGVATGTATITAAADGVTATVTITVTPAPPSVVVDSFAPKADPADPDLPTLFLTTALAATPSTARVINVSATDNLQTVLDTAQYGDKIILAAGATFIGNFVLPAKSGGTLGEWITIQGGASIPSEGSRVSPASATNFPKLITSSVSPALRTAFGAARWRVIGIEITSTPNLVENYGLVNLGDGDPSQNLLSEVATDLIFDRVYVHGQTNVDIKRCFAFNSARTALIDSYVSECHSHSDAQAVGGWNGPGPYRIVGNYLEAAAEVIAFGGADPGIANLIPSDIEIRRNHITKPLAWKGVWLTKNLVEFKVGRRVLIEGNVIENSAVDAQDGSAFVLWSVNQNGGCTWCVTEHMTIRNNIIRNVAAGFQLTAKFLDQPSGSMNHLAIRNNMLIGVGNPFVGTNGKLFLMQGIIASLTIENNTAFSPNNSSFLWSGQQPSPDLLIKNNLTGGGQYQIFSSQGSGTAAVNFASGPGSAFAGNVVALADPAGSPTGNFYPATLTAIGLTGGATAAYSVSATLTDLSLASSSPFKGKGTDGKDPGANATIVQSATAGVVK